MKALKTIYISIFIVLVLGFFNGIAWAIPSADFLYMERNIGGGLWQYDYTLFNTSDPVADAGFDLYEVTITFNPSAFFTLLSLPSMWDWIGGTGFTVTFSTAPGVPPLGADIAPGSPLGVFSFQFNYQAGAIPFYVAFVNPHDPSNPTIYSGTSAPVPEPPTIVNNSVTFAPISSTFNYTSNTSGCPSGFVGKYSFKSRLTNTSSSLLSNLAVKVATLTNENLLQNADGGPGGVGATLTVPKADGFADGLLSKGEYVDAPFVLCLKQRTKFSFFVDVWGIKQ